MELQTNSLKINFNSFILFLALPFTSHPNRAQLQLSVSFRRSLWTEHIYNIFVCYSLMANIKAQKHTKRFELRTVFAVKSGEMDFSTPSNSSAINLWTEECLARRNSEIANNFSPSLSVCSFSILDNFRYFHFTVSGILDHDCWQVFSTAFSSETSSLNRNVIHICSTRTSAMIKDWNISSFSRVHKFPTIVKIVFLFP